MQLKDLPNIGVKLEKQLNDVGIASVEQLKAVGSREAWLRIYAQDSSACINRLLGIEGSIRGVRKSELPDDVKKELLAFYREAKAKKTK